MSTKILRQTWKKATIPISVLLLLAGFTAVGFAGWSSASGYLGVRIAGIPDTELEEMDISHGVRIERVIAESPAEKAGLQVDDIIQYFDDKKIRDPEDLTHAVRRTAPETKVKTDIIRDKQKMSVEIEIGALKPEHGYSFTWDKNTFCDPGGAYLGVHLFKLNRDLAEYFDAKDAKGTLILEVENYSPADDAGLKAGDVIVEMDAKKIDDPDDVKNILSDLEEDNTIEIGYIRQGKKQVVKVELDEAPRRHEIFIRKYPGCQWGPKHMRFNFPIPFDEIEFPDIYIDPPLELELKKLEDEMKSLRKNLPRQINKAIGTIPL